MNELPPAAALASPPAAMAAAAAATPTLPPAAAGTKGWALLVDLLPLATGEGDAPGVLGLPAKAPCRWLAWGLCTTGISTTPTSSCSAGCCCEDSLWLKPCCRICCRCCCCPNGSGCCGCDPPCAWGPCRPWDPLAWVLPSPALLLLFRNPSCSPDVSLLKTSRGPPPAPQAAPSPPIPKDRLPKLAKVLLPLLCRLAA